MTLGQVVDLMRAEFADAGEDFTAVAREITAAAEAEDPVKRLRRHLSEVDSPDRGLRILQQAVPATGPDVWPLLPEADRRQLLRDHYRSMMSLCCPMPATTATALLGMVDSGQLRIVSDVRAVEPTPGGGFALRTGDGAPPLRADRLINAVNPAPGGLPARAQSLVTSLVSEGLAELHPRGGVVTERATSRLLTGGGPTPVSTRSVTWPRAACSSPSGSPPSSTAPTTSCRRSAPVTARRCPSPRTPYSAPDAPSSVVRRPTARRARRPTVRRPAPRTPPDP
ncbi:hypothetical protein EQG64_09005 [Streptomyces sp. S6]|nr:hypothetical protein EQG64_09005 [Streptomyces sp. S6]